MHGSECPVLATCYSSSPCLDSPLVFQEFRVVDSSHLAWDSVLALEMSYLRKRRSPGQVGVIGHWRLSLLE